MDRDLDFQTRAAHAGIRVRSGDYVSTVAPIDLSTTFSYDSIEGVHRALEPGGSGFAYARNANPTVALLEQAIEGLEGAGGAVAFASGMAAIDAVVSAAAGAGGTVVASGDVYGVTRALLTHLEATAGMRVHYADVLDLQATRRLVRDVGAQLLYFESISNPLLHVADVAALIEIARDAGALTVVDNTFGTPYLIRPIEAGADFVLHSATKYIAGHGDVVAGLVAGDVEWMQEIRRIRTLRGSVLGPFDAWLAMRGLRTLAVRLDRQCATALELARALTHEEWVERVYYPGLPDHPQHGLAGAQFEGKYGAMIAFDVRADRVGTLGFIDGLRLIAPGTSLGDVETLVLYPPLSSHRSLSREELAAAGIGDGLVRMSVGLESTADLLADLRSAARSSGLLERAAVSR